MIRAIIFAIALVVLTSVMGSVIILIGFFQSYSKFSYHQILRRWARMLIWISGSRVRLSGVENLDPQRCYVLVSNHQSHVDIPALVGYLPIHMTIIAKKELFKIPIFAQAMRALGILEIDRSNRAKSFATLKRAAEVMREKKLSVLAFPEGTRSEDGKMKAFKKGPFVLGIQSEMAILPITIDGTYPMLPKGKLGIRPGDIRIQIHPAIETTDFSFEKRNELIDQVHHTIASGLADHEEFIEKFDYPESSAG